MSFLEATDWAEESGAALPAVLVMILIFTVLTGAVLATRLAQHRFIGRDVDRLQAYYAAEAGLYRALARLERRPTWRTRKKEISCPQAHTCRITVETYGGFVRLASTASTGRQTKRLQALAAHVPGSLFENALVIGEAQSDLVLAGEARVVGDVVMEGTTVRGSALGGVPFTGRFEGDVRPEPDFALPAFEARLPRETMQRLLRLVRHPPPEAFRIEEIRRRALSDGPEDIGGYAIYVHAEGDLTLTPTDSFLSRAPTVIVATKDLFVHGPIEFHPGSRLVAGRALYVTGPVQATQSLLCAGGQVQVTGAMGRAVQVLAGREATVAGRSHLRYPSFVYVEGTVEEKRRTGGLLLGGTAVVDGTLLYPPPVDTANVEHDEGRVVVGEGAVLRGVLYSAARTELKGTVLGTVMTRRFFFYRSPTTYVNWIDGGIVEPGRRPPGYLAPIGFNAGGKKERLGLIRLNTPGQAQQGTR